MNRIKLPDPWASLAPTASVNIVAIAVSTNVMLASFVTCLPLDGSIFSQKDG